MDDSSEIVMPLDSTPECRAVQGVENDLKTIAPSAFSPVINHLVFRQYPKSAQSGVHQKAYDVLSASGALCGVNIR